MPAAITPRILAELHALLRSFATAQPFASIPAPSIKIVINWSNMRQESKRKNQFIASLKQVQCQLTKNNLTFRFDIPVFELNR